MKIYKMTATFGKLEHESLILQPGLNIIQAPNEWGKSTWCAFLLAMLYGLDTRARTTKTDLADKERYAPWSGSPMSGRVDLCWNGRDITIERLTKGRIPLGEFRAYETKTGILLPELTAANCGQTLLGVEQSVFRRAGFVRLSDMPVTADEALRRRLSALVTTGDETGDAEKLEKGLKELKNRCRHNRTGLIPQAEAEKETVEKKLRELETLEIQSKKLRSRLGEAKAWARELENHRAAIAYDAAQTDAARLAKARECWEAAEKQLAEAENACANCPKMEEAEEKIRKIREFQRKMESYREEEQTLPQGPEAPKTPEPFRNMPLPFAREMVEADIPRYELLKGSKPYLVPFLMAGALLFLGILAGISREWVIAAATEIAGLAFLWLGCRKRRSWEAESALLEEKYGTDDPSQWLRWLEEYEQNVAQYAQNRKKYASSRSQLEEKAAALEKQRQSLCGGQSPEAVVEIWEDVRQKWMQYHNLRQEAIRCRDHYQTISAMIRPVKPPQMADRLTYSANETDALLDEVALEQQRLLGRLGQYRGRMEALGEESELTGQLRDLEEKIEKWEAVYAAAQVGLDTLAQAKLELQRRFAPKIVRKAQKLLGDMTAGRYRDLTLSEDFRIRAGAGEEDILRDALWRSDGTVDQLYLALRLAVAQELTPEAPLVLDDALVRFDDTRLKAALEILQEMAKDKQILLFSCQNREKNLLNQ